MKWKKIWKFLLSNLFEKNYREIEIAHILINDESKSNSYIIPDMNIDSSEISCEISEKKRDSVSNSEDEDLNFLLNYVRDAKERLNTKREIRAVNQLAPHNRPEESNYTKLDSSLKKNTAFIRRLRNMTDNQKNSIIRDMESLNLSKYISEVATAIVETKLKMSDIATGVHICSLLHQKYAEFSQHLLDCWQKTLTLRKDEKIINLSKLRVDIRFYAELIAAGIFTHKEGLPLLGNLLTNLINMDKDDHNNLSIILSFCKHCGEDYAGLLPKKIQQLAVKYQTDVPQSDLLTPEKQKNVRLLLKEYYTTLIRRLLKDYKELKGFERQNYRILQSKGEITQERQEKFEIMNSSFQKLFYNTQQFADMLGEELPQLPKEETSDSDDKTIVIRIGDEYGFPDKNDVYLFWEDDDTKTFYESLPDLKSIIPSILYKDSVQVAMDTIEVKSNEEFSEEMLDLEEIENVDKEGMLEKKIQDEEILPPQLEDESEDFEHSNASTNRMLLDTFLSKLSTCVNREMIDSAATEFCMTLNTKANRRKLVKTLFLVPRIRLDLLPFYARFVAILHPCMPDVANDLCQMLKQDFRYQVWKKDQINIESKIKVCRFIGELVKFQIFSKTDALYCLKQLLFNFSHHHIEMACNLLESCGRFLFRSPDSHQRTKIYLEQMMRRKVAIPMDLRYVMMIENAYYYCNPPDVPVQSSFKERPPMHEYIRKLLYKDLNKTTTEKILRLIRKMNWDDDRIAEYIRKCLTNVWNVKYYNIRCVANLLAGLSLYQEATCLKVVDGVLENIRIGMEINLPKFNQHRVSTIKYLGELYNYRMIESSVIFKVLYSFITFGTSLNNSSEVFTLELDPADNLFRIKLICILLDTCGQYFNSGSSKRKLDCFFVYFQKYFWMKKKNPYFEENQFPISVEHSVRDIIFLLRPKMKFAENYDEVQKLVLELELELVAKLRDVFPALPQTHEDDNINGLSTIKEYDEEFTSSELDINAELDIEEDGSQVLDSNVWIQEDSLSQQSQPNDCDDESAEEDISPQIDDIDHDKIWVSKHIDRINCPEDDEFTNAFDKILSESIQDRNRELIKPTHMDISIPFYVRNNIKRTHEHLGADDELGDQTTFVLMTRKGNKQQYKNVSVPSDSELAQNLRHCEEVERLEKQHIKKVTLDINERQEEEDYQEMLAQSQKTNLNINRERKPKYQHQRGVPDADIIFGTKKLR